MKKSIAILLTLILTLSLSATAFAAEIKQDSDPKTADVEVTTSIEPTYTVTIPSNATVEFNAETTSFGAVTLDAAQIDPGYAVKVELNTDGTLENQADTTKTIAYTVNDASGAAFTAAEYTKAGENTPLTINITKDAWNAASAGDYKDIVTFTVSYAEA